MRSAAGKQATYPVHEAGFFWVQQAPAELQDFRLLKQAVGDQNPQKFAETQSFFLLQIHELQKAVLLKQKSQMKQIPSHEIGRTLLGADRGRFMARGGGGVSRLEGTKTRTTCRESKTTEHNKMTCSELRRRRFGCQDEQRHHVHETRHSPFPATVFIICVSHRIHVQVRVTEVAEKVADRHHAILVLVYFAE